MKAVGLFSGGLDSILSSHIILDQGLSITCLFIGAPFINTNQNIIGNSFESLHRRGAELVVEKISPDYLDILKHPKHGFGSAVNPCIDCHTYMLKMAKELMLERGADFVFTGEVLGERPMSQNRQALEIIEEGSGLVGILLRPLSAKLLSPTEVELEGKVKRENLFGIKGRSRKPQLELARKYNLEFIPSSGGGCLLTEKAFAVRVRELMENEDIDMDMILLLRYGRHFRLPTGAKLIVGRNEEENVVLEKCLTPEYTVLEPVGVMGPTAVLTRDSDIELASSIIARYCDGDGAVKVRISKESIGEEIIVERLDDSKLREFMVI
jgi:hypothetical protein